MLIRYILQIKIYLVGLQKSIKQKTMKQKIKIIALGIFLTSFVFSCSENEPISKDSAISREQKGVAIELGKRLENPYSV